jgi:formate/nitrite transporter FocA (FNT family)
VAIGVLAFLVVLHDTGRDLLAGIAFSTGFIALLLGRSELFTEGFWCPW